ncbi:MAG TPA: DUF3052 domain-containing protein [Terracidiphilus sp.]|jgi:hypothetical protein
MAGYSGTPLLKKLGIKDGHRVLLRNAPADLPEELKEYARTRFGNNLDVVLLFADSLAVFRAEFGRLMQVINTNGMIWVAWPKKASGIRTDLTEKAIRDCALATHFVDVKVCAIDDTWSGLKLVIRKELRTSFDTGTH